MSLSGSFEGLSPSDLLQMLAWGAKTGLLTSMRNEERRHVFLKHGDVVGVTSSRYKDRLGAVMLRMNFITQQQFDDILNLQASNGRQLGEMFLDQHIVSESNLNTSLVLQAEDIIYDLLSWTEGDFSFEERELTAEEYKIKPIVISNLLLEGARRIDEIDRVREIISDPDTVFCCMDGVDPDSLNLSRPRKTIVSMLKIPWAVVDIIRMANESEYDIYSALYYLLQQNIIVEVEKATRQRKQQKERIHNLMEMAQNMEQKGWFHEALSNIGEILLKSPKHKDAELTKIRLENKILQSAKSVFKSVDVVPTIRHSVAAVSADKLCLNQREGLVFFRIDGSTNLKNLRYITNMNEDDLYIILHKFIRMGLIYLEDPAEKKRKILR
ncbi:DUF4388 domain-containing protein [bacterium]|nr:DUF4388 domain-containing protein [candidate division CSSED10-310 bacterium]